MAPKLQGIEIERKFFLTTKETALLEQSLGSASQRQQMRDVYVDTARYELTLMDWWLRSRGNTWELKVPLRSNSFNFSQYEELDEEHAICERLGIAGLPPASSAAEPQGFVAQLTDGAGSSVPHSLRPYLHPENVTEEVAGTVAAQRGQSITLLPCADLTTERRTYTSPRDPRVHVDIDVVRFLPPTSPARAANSDSDDSFSICEVEIMADDGAAAVAAAEEALQREVCALGLGQCQKGYSKVYEYLKRHSPDHYAVLLERRRSAQPSPGIHLSAQP
jgi:hypothetical protein